MTDPEISPPKSADDGCTCAFVDGWSETQGAITYTRYAILVHEAPGWKFDHIDVYYVDETGEIRKEEFSWHEFIAIGNGALRVPDPDTSYASNLWPVVEWEGVLFSPVFKRMSRAEAVFVEVSTGKILHGSSGAVLCGKAGLPLFDNKNGAY